jgi:hypothetical protein
MLKTNKLRARNSIILLAIIFILSVVSIISDLMQYALLNSEIGFTVEEGEQNDLRQQIIAIFMVVAYILSYTFFIMWFRRAYFNLHQKVNYLEFSEGWAAGAWFVPILNYFRPYHIMKELYVETENYLVKNKTNYTKTLNLSLIGIWWASWIIVSIFDRISYRLSNNCETIEEMSTATLFSIVNEFITLPACILAIKVINDYNKVEEILFEQNQFEKLAFESETKLTEMKFEEELNKKADL